jgi:hypothetical protein
MLEKNLCWRETETLENARPEGINQNIGGGQDAQKNLSRFRLTQVKCYRGLATSELISTDCRWPVDSKD